VWSHGRFKRRGWQLSPYRRHSLLMMRNWFFCLLPGRCVQCVQNGTPKGEDTLSRADDLNLHVDAVFVRIALVPSPIIPECCLVMIRIPTPWSHVFCERGLDWQDDGPSRPHDQESPCLTFENDNEHVIVGSFGTP
jgi:hypothetical protein